jgi:hypothetical protein
MPKDFDGRRCNASDSDGGNSPVRDGRGSHGSGASLAAEILSDRFCHFYVELLEMISKRSKFVWSEPFQRSLGASRCATQNREISSRDRLPIHSNVHRCRADWQEINIDEEIILQKENLSDLSFLRRFPVFLTFRWLTFDRGKSQVSKRYTVIARDILCAFCHYVLMPWHEVLGTKLAYCEDKTNINELIAIVRIYNIMDHYGSEAFPAEGQHHWSLLHLPSGSEGTI